jgi:hypothetical protein
MNSQKWKTETSKWNLHKFLTCLLSSPTSKIDNASGIISKKLLWLFECGN